MADHCYACSVSLHLSDFKGPSDVYCRYCADENGQLRSKEEIRANIAHWMMSWQPNVDEKTASERAERFMSALPAWTE